MEFTLLLQIKINHYFKLQKTLSISVHKINSEKPYNFEEITSQCKFACCCYVLILYFEIKLIPTEKNST